MHDATLDFREDNGPLQGFTNTDANRDLVKDETVIRELVQNALDAQNGKNSACRVAFTLDTIRWEDIPGGHTYKQAFEAARNLLENDEPATGRQVIERIENSIKSPSVTMLVCADNGDGIGPKELRSLYSSGRSTKQISGRGSVGHGHLTAFAPSHLRYVLYAGLQSNTQETFGGHAILATQRHNVDGKTLIKNHDGFIRHNLRDGQQVLFENEVGSKFIPDRFSRYFEDKDTGSAVIILGYDPIAETKIDTEDIVLPAAAYHFLVAVHDGILDVVYGNGHNPPAMLHKPTLPHYLQKIIAPRDHKYAHRTLKTIRDDGYKLDEQLVYDTFGPGVRIWLRPTLDKEEYSRPRVSIHRDGMWIEDNTINYLQPNKFSKVEPFDAVVALDSSIEGSFGYWVRKAEGASHARISPKEIETENRKTLLKYLTSLQELLISRAEPLDNNNDYEPPELRLLGASMFMKSIPKRRPPRTEPKEQDSAEEEQNLPKDSANGNGNGESAAHDFDSDREKTENLVKAGNSSGIATSCRPDSTADGIFHVSWKVTKGTFHAGDAGLRLIIPSGTDQTSRRRLPPKYLKIVDVSIEGENLTSVLEDYEIPIHNPSLDGRAQVTIRAKDAAQLGLEKNFVEADVVHRDKTKKRLDG